MDRREVCELLVKLEKKNINKFSHGGICIWPMIRFHISNELFNFTAIEKVSLPSKGENKINYRCIDDDRSYINTDLADSVLSRKYETLKSNFQSDEEKYSSEFIYLSPANTLAYLPQFDLLYDRIIDPFLEITKKICTTSKLYLNKTGDPDFNQCYYPGSEIIRENCDKDFLPLPESLYYELIELLKGYPVDPLKIYNKLSDGWPAFLTGIATAEKLCQDYTKLKFVGIVAWIQSVFHQGLIVGLKKNNIKVFEIQHGAQGEYMSYYTHWTNIPVEGYHMMPDIFLNWGEDDYNNVKRSCQKNDNYTNMVLGFPWPDFYLNKISPMNISSGISLKSEQKKNIILVTLQTKTENTPDLLPPFILNLLKSKREDNYNCFILLRPHPNQPNTIPFLHELLKDVSKDKYRICAVNENLYDLFSSVTHHVTAFSTCGFEASFFNIPTFCFGKNAQLLYKNEIERNEITWSEGTLSDFLLWLDTEHKVKRNNNLFISSLEFTEKVLRDIYSSPITKFLPERKNPPRIQLKKKGNPKYCQTKINGITQEFVEISLFELNLRYIRTQIYRLFSHVTFGKLKARFKNKYQKNKKKIKCYRKG